MIGPDSCDFHEKIGTELTNFAPFLTKFAPFLTNFATSLVSFGASKVFFGANKVKSGADKTKGRAFKVFDASKDPKRGTELVLDAPKYPTRGVELVFDGPFSVLDGVELVLSGPKDPSSVAESGGIVPGLRADQTWVFERLPGMTNRHDLWALLPAAWIRIQGGRRRRAAA